MKLALGVMLCAFLVLAQDPTKVLPRNYRIVYDNPTVEVVHVLYGPHEKLPVHNHSDKPTIYVYLSDSGRFVSATSRNTRSL